MEPDAIEWVEISDHAESKMRVLDVDRDLIIGRVRHRHANIYIDHDKGGYNYYLPDRRVVIAVKMQYNPVRECVQGVVKTVFPLACPTPRFEQDRFGEWE